MIDMFFFFRFEMLKKMRCLQNKCLYIYTESLSNWPKCGKGYVVFMC